MSDIKYKKHLLATIDKLRSRKSRPDVGRICKFMLKFHKISPKDTKADLRKCVKEECIKKVDYKGNISYRNSQRLRRRKTSPSSSMASSSTAPHERRVITSAIATLIYQDQSYLENGISFEALIKAAGAQPTKFTKKQLEAIVQKELASGSLVRLPNQNLALGPADNDGDSCDSFRYDYQTDSNTKTQENKKCYNIGTLFSQPTSSANSSSRSSPLRQRGRPRKHANGKTQSTTSKNTRNSSGVRVGERRKMAKKVFDPSDVNVSNKKKRGRPVGSLNKSTIEKRMSMKRMLKASSPDSQLSNESEEEIEETNEKEESGGVCSVCITQQPKGSNDRLIECKDCSSKAHLSCLQSGPAILKLCPDNTWQCPHCKTCVVCCETNDAGVLTMCSICSDLYHALCHSPRIPERVKAWDQWKCTNCLESRPPAASSPAIAPIKTYSRVSSNSSPYMKPHEIDTSPSKANEETTIDVNIPNITNWSNDDVFEYFNKHLPETAPVLKEQDMDGAALCMARRSDIVKGLGLPLGPALALYRIVVKLQTRKDDWTMCWG